MNFNFKDYSMTRLIIISTSIIYLLQLFFPIITTKLLLYPYQSENNHLFQYLTAIFLHGSFLHIFFNMLVLSFFGDDVEKFFGKYNFILLYLIIGVFANILWHTFYISTNPALGGSGSIFGIMTIYAIINPKQIVYLYFLIPIKMGIAVILIIIYEFISMMFFNDNTAHGVHLLGAFVGTICYLYKKVKK